MDFQVSDDTRFERVQVWTAQRDHFAEIAPRMSEIERVSLRSRADGARGDVEQVHLWHLSPNALPALLRPMLPPALLQWEDRQRWDPGTWVCTWELLHPALGSMVEVRGVQRYVEREQGGTRIELEGSFLFRPDAHPQLKVPSAARPLVEKFVVRMLVPLIQRSGHEVVAWLEEQHPG